MKNKSKVKVILYEMINRLARKMAQKDIEYEDKINALKPNEESEEILIKQAVDSLQNVSGEIHWKQKTGISLCSNEFNCITSDLEASIKNTKRKIKEFSNEMAREKASLLKTNDKEVIKI